MLDPFQPPFKQLFGFGEDEEKEQHEQEFEDEEDVDASQSYPDYDAMDNDAIASMHPGYEKRKRNSSFTDDYDAADDKALNNHDDSDDCYCGRCNIGAEF